MPGDIYIYKRGFLLGSGGDGRLGGRTPSSKGGKLNGSDATANEEKDIADRGHVT